MSRDADRKLGTGKTIIGILGGMGPRATWAFCEVLTREFSFDREREHPRILVDCNTQISSRTAAVFDGGPSPVPNSVESINGLIKLGATIIAAPCNQIHYWHDEIQSQISVPWPSMVKIVADKLDNVGGIMILGGPVTIQKRIYTKYLTDTIYPSELLEKEIYARIEKGKQSLAAGNIDSLIPELASKYKPAAVLLACTELSASPRWDSWVYSSLEIYAHEIAEMVKNG